MIKQLFDIPAVPEIEPKFIFGPDNEVFKKHEALENEVINCWKNIVNKKGFVALQFITGGRYPQTVMLSKSTKQKNGWQLSFIDFDGVPCRDEQYTKDFVAMSGIGDLFRNLMHYSWHNNQIFVEARYKGDI